MFTYRTGEKGQHSENLHYNDNLVYNLSSDIDLEDIVLKDIKFIEDVLNLHKKSINWHVIVHIQFLKYRKICSHNQIH